MANENRSQDLQVETTDIKSLPCRIREVEHAWIPLSDGTRLACRYWLPENAEQHPVPAILEYIPYCKRDRTSERDEAMHPYLAGHGYCAIRVDMRGSGESEGLLLDEYLPQEQDDALEVIAWIAEQPWCSGNVGMFGKSWGGYNSLQVAARRPPALKAIITVYSVDDRYADCIHIAGGCLLLENPNWAFNMFGLNARPPDPLLFGEGWREVWMQRIENNVPWIIEWLKHQRRDDFWKHASVCEDYSSIVCPVFAVGGWADAYTNPVLRLMENLTVSRRALIGPWGHEYPHHAYPEPQIGFLQESLRWWNHWLKGIDTGQEDEPMVRVWMQDSYEPDAMRDVVPGSWVSEDCWPSERIETRHWQIQQEGLVALERIEPAMLYPSAETSRLQISSPATVGRTNPVWGHFGMKAPEFPMDQRLDDAVSLCFDSQHLQEPVAILGTPIVELEVTSDKPVAQISLRLSEVRVDGKVTQVSFGVFNLTHDQKHETVTAVEIGVPMKVRVRLNDTAYRFAAGSCIRIAVATGLWPVIWPSPEIVTLEIGMDVSQLELPVRDNRETDANLRAFDSPKWTPIQSRTKFRPQQPVVARMEEDMATGKLAYVQEEDEGITQIDSHGWKHGNKMVRRYEIDPRDSLSASIYLEGEDVYGREGELDALILTRCRMTSNSASFRIEASLEVLEDSRQIFFREWDEEIPRDGV